MWDPVLVSKYPLVFVISADKWDPPVISAVNWMQIRDLSNLKKLCEKMVDFGSHNVKWYYLVNLARNMVVLC
jgi:hypothetical protein